MIVLVCASAGSQAQTVRPSVPSKEASSPEPAPPPRGPDRDRVVPQPGLETGLAVRTSRLNPVTLFQRFVQEATGTWLPVFGSEFFRARPGDTARGNAEISSRRGDPAKRSRPGVRVRITGPAAQPGSITLPPHSTALAAVVAAGGPSSAGSFRSVSVVRGGQAVAQLDLYELIVQGVTRADIELRDGDTVSFQPAGAQVALAGALDARAIYELKPSGETVASLLAYAGSNVLLADRLRVVLERIDSRLPAARQVEHMALDAAGLARGLQDGDVLTLLAISPAIANAVTLVGPVTQPGRYAFRQGMRVSDLIPDLQALVDRDFHERKNRLLIEPADALAASSGTSLNAQRLPRTAREDAPDPATLFREINLEHAVVERLSGDDLRTQVIPFNLRAAVEGRDPRNDIELRPGDVVTVYRADDVRVAQDRLTRLVSVEGEVAAPGVGDFKQFKSGHQFGAWLGLVPRQDSSGGKVRLGRITKRGDDYLRTLLIQGAKAAVMTAGKRDDPTSRWLVPLTARVGWQKACVAMANKNARVLWAVMTREEGFDPNHVSVKPKAKQAQQLSVVAPPSAPCACPA